MGKAVPVVRSVRGCFVSLLKHKVNLWFLIYFQRFFGVQFLFSVLVRSMALEVGETYIDDMLLS